MESSSNSEKISSSSNGEVIDKCVDYANYFSNYAFLNIQKQMLCDRVRMNAYYNAIFENKHHFNGKTVLDVGTGSGILAIWAGQAGARKVYAVEATTMANHARVLVNANNLQHKIEVIQGTIENITLPERVDVIISEWMGHFLLRESMLDSVIYARDRWLKPTGVMYPSHARMWYAPIRSDICDKKSNDYKGSMCDWHHFINETKTNYGVDMSVLTYPFNEESEKYHLQTSICWNIHPDQVIGSSAMIMDIDCSTVGVADIRRFNSVFTSIIFKENNTRLCGFAGWFDVCFLGNKTNPVAKAIELTTAPSEVNGTHWGQQLFLLDEAKDVSKGDALCLRLTMERSKKNHRSLEIQLYCGIFQKLALNKRFYIE